MEQSVQTRSGIISIYATILVTTIITKILQISQNFAKVNNFSLLAKISFQAIYICQTLFTTILVFYHVDNLPPIIHSYSSRLFASNSELLRFTLWIEDPNHNIESILISSNSTFDSFSNKTDRNPFQLSENTEGNVTFSWTPTEPLSFTIFVRDSLGLFDSWTPRISYCDCNQQVFYPCNFKKTIILNGKKFFIISSHRKIISRYK